jgi:hypothetical protein
MKMFILDRGNYVLAEADITGWRFTMGRDGIENSDWRDVRVTQGGYPESMRVENSLGEIVCTGPLHVIKHYARPGSDLTFMPGKFSLTANVMHSAQETSTQIRLFR